MPSAQKILLETRQKLLEYQRKKIQKQNVKRLRELRLSLNNHRRLRLLQDPKEYYQIGMERERHPRKFKVKQKVYKVNVNILPVQDQSPGVRQLL